MGLDIKRKLKSAISIHFNNEVKRDSNGVDWNVDGFVIPGELVANIYRIDKCGPPYVMALVCNKNIVVDSKLIQSSRSCVVLHHDPLCNPQDTLTLIKLDLIEKIVIEDSSSTVIRDLNRRP